MRFILLFLFTFVIILGCRKDEPGDFIFEIRLVDEFGSNKDLFGIGDSLIFDFYITNNTSNEATYLRPCSEFGEFLNIYKENIERVYEYFGKPEYYCAAVVEYGSIGAKEKIKLGSIPWSQEFGWPGKEPGKYYVGDTFSLVVNEKQLDYQAEIHFEIE